MFRPQPLLLEENTMKHLSTNFFRNFGETSENFKRAHTKATSPVAISPRSFMRYRIAPV